MRSATPRGNSRSPRTGRPARWGAGTGGNELVAISTHFFRAGATGIRECTEKAEIGQYPIDRTEEFTPRPGTLGATQTGEEIGLEFVRDAEKC